MTRRTACVFVDVALATRLDGLDSADYGSTHSVDVRESVKCGSVLCSSVGEAKQKRGSASLAQRMRRSEMIEAQWMLLIGRGSVGVAQ